MTAQIIPFPARGPFDVSVMRAADDEKCWLVVCRSHAWLHGDLDDAIDDAAEIADGFAVQVKMKAGTHCAKR